MTIPLRKPRVDPHEIQRRVKLRVVNGDLSFNDRLETLLGAMLLLSAQEGVQVKRVLSANIPEGCIDLLLRGRVPIRVPDATVEIRVSAWP